MSDLFQYSNQKTLVEDYFVDGFNLDFNYKIFQELTEFTMVVDISEKRLKFEEKKDDKGQSLNLTPLDFFNLLYHEYDFIVENKLRPLSIIPRLKGISLSFFDRLYFYVKLSELLYLTNDHTLTFIGNIINIEYSRVLNGFFGDNLINEIDVISDEDKNAINERYNAIIDVDKRLSFLAKTKCIITQLKPNSAGDLLFLEQIEALIKYNKELKDLGIDDKSTSNEKGGHNKNIKREITLPSFRRDYIDTIFNQLKDYFPEEQQQELNSLFINKTRVGSKLQFMDNGNKLVNAFKQLYDNNIITGCKKSDLELWIFNNFQFKSEDGLIDFKPKYLNRIISTNEHVCQNTIFKLNVRNLSYSI